MVSDEFGNWNRPEGLIRKEEEGGGGDGKEEGEVTIVGNSKRLYTRARRISFFGLLFPSLSQNLRYSLLSSYSATW
jgi:hypothetical protein